MELLYNQKCLVCSEVFMSRSLYLHHNRQHVQSTNLSEELTNDDNICDTDVVPTTLNQDNTGTWYSENNYVPIVLNQELADNSIWCPENNDIPITSSSYQDIVSDSVDTPKFDEILNEAHTLDTYQPLSEQRDHEEYIAKYANSYKIIEENLVRSNLNSKNLSESHILKCLSSPLDDPLALETIITNDDNFNKITAIVNNELDETYSDKFETENIVGFDDNGEDKTYILDVNINESNNDLECNTIERKRKYNVDCIKKQLKENDTVDPLENLDYNDSNEKNTACRFECDSKIDIKLKLDEEIEIIDVYNDDSTVANDDRDEVIFVPGAASKIFKSVTQNSSLDLNIQPRNVLTRRPTTKNIPTGAMRNQLTGNYKCAGCAAPFLSSASLRTHQERRCQKFKEANNTSRKACPKCCRLVSNMDVHLQAHNLFNGLPSLRCFECQRMFSSKNTLTQHILDYHFETGRIYKCHVCAKQFHTQWEYDNHLLTGHPRNGQAMTATTGRSQRSDKQLYRMSSQSGGSGKIRNTTAGWSQRI